MLNMIVQNKKRFLILLSAGLIVTTVIIILIYCIFSWIASLISWPISLLLFILLLYYLLHLSIRLSVFPGSTWLWRRSIESHFCKQISMQLLARIQDLHIALEILLDECNEIDKREFLSNSADATNNAKLLLITAIYGFNLQKENQTITRKQEILLNFLVSLQCSLQEIKIILENKEECSMWDWIDTIESEADWLGVVFGDFPVNASARTALGTCIDIECILQSSYEGKNIIEKAKNFLWDDTFGTLDQMRLELEARYHSQQIWVTADDGINIDCLWISCTADLSSAPAMLMCSPNAGIYEFSYYQSDWIDFYINLGISVFLWNYRGYGRTKGNPTPDRLKKDGEIILDYLKKIRKVEKIGIHGESFGGCIAANLARKLNVQFVFLDRCFSSLNEMAFYNFGIVASYIYKYIGRWHVDVTSDFISCECYKILAVDPQDGTIHDLASLKTGIALEIIKKSHEIPNSQAKFDINSYDFILCKTDIDELLVHIDTLMKLAVKYLKSDSNTQFSLNITANSQYQLMVKESDCIEDDVVSYVLEKLFGVLDVLDAGGKPIANIVFDKDRKYSLNLWLIVLEIWGSYLPLNPDINDYAGRTIQKIKNTIEEMESIYAEYEIISNPTVVIICNEIKAVEKLLYKILDYFQTNSSHQMKAISQISSEILTTTSRTNDFSRAGYLIPISCGHSGNYDDAEKLLLEEHLIQVGFIKN
ncbi:unnamed protein product [Blepharisma stoltei]|uniref:Alpha/beta hydrolase n=1 Tax=Blepharisma stoltei TaxID=1481888 RepID=A0AAU9I622_9CILI|nr:unnamed protein product [Blepharisma stoltei]